MNTGKTLKDIAEETGINYSTLRGYVDRFDEYIPTYHADGVRWKLYEPAAIPIVQLIAEHYADGKHIHEIRGVLEAAGHHPIIEAETDEETERDSDALGVSEPIAPLSHYDDLLRATREALHLAMESLRHFRELAQYKQEQIDNQSETIAALKAQIDALEAKDDSTEG